ncbi:replication protein A subunit RPA32, partial [Dendrothele bispora CBS 962.96]
GGGFYATQSSPFGGSPGGGSIERTELSHSIRPLTAAQFWKATQSHTDAEWQVDGIEIGQVTIVGQVVTINRQATNCQYSIEDGTASIEARHWMETNSDDNAKWGHIEENTYVRVTGNLKAFSNRRYINAISIRPIDDPHELYFHLLECIYVTMMLKHGSPTGLGDNAQAGQNANMNSSVSAYTAQPSGRSDANPEYARLPPLQRQIIEIILQRPERHDEGVHITTIVKALDGPKAEANNISDAIDHLMDAGHIFTTSDDQHYQVSQ